MEKKYTKKKINKGKKENEDRKRKQTTYIYVF
jgi:hypothetical protein